MTDTNRILWVAVRRGLLLICKAIERNLGLGANREEEKQKYG